MVEVSQRIGVRGEVQSYDWIKHLCVDKKRRRRHKHALIVSHFMVSMERRGKPFEKSNLGDWCRSEPLVSVKEAALYATGPETGYSQHVINVEEFFELS